MGIINISGSIVAIALFVCLISLAESQQSCNFNGPKDRPTLQGVNFISNVGTGECLQLERFGVKNRIPIILDSCQWNTRRPSPEQLFTVKNSGGGSTLKPAQTSASDLCLATHEGKLSTKLCAPKNDEQNWLINNIRGKFNEFQIIQNSSGRCLKVNSGFGSNNVVLAPCSLFDKLQIWKICTSN